MVSRQFDEVIAALKAQKYKLARSKLQSIDLTGIDQSSAALYRHLETELLDSVSPTGDVVKTGVGKNCFKQTLTQNTFLIVTPVYNCSEYINETVQSVVSQKGHFDIWYHVQDGGSTDGTLAVLKAWEEKLEQDEMYSASRLHFSWNSQKDNGMYDAITKGFNCLKSKINIEDESSLVATWINADDILSPNALLTVAAFISQSPRCNWFTGIGSTIDASGATTAVYDKPPAYSSLMLEHGLYDGRHTPYFLAQEGTFWKFSLWQQVNGVDSCMRYAGDWDLWRRFAALTPLVKIEAVLAYHRRHEGQLSDNMNAYYAEIDARSSFSSLAALELEETGSRGVFDQDKARWCVIQAETNAFLIRNRQVESSQKTQLISPLDPYPVTAPNGKPWPKISVVTPSYNQGKYIRETIESVLLQGYPNLEYIIIDGGSTDDTVEIIKEFQYYISYYVSEEDKGQSHAINKGFNKAEGEIFTWLNSDDQFAPNALFSMALAFATSNADLVAGICEVYENNKLVHRHMTSCQEGDLPLEAILDLETGWDAGQFFFQPEVFFKRTLWEKAGAHVREDCFYSMDYELWCRFAAVKAKLHVIGKPIVHFRSHPEQKTADPAKFKAELKIVKENFIREWNIPPKPTNRPNLGRIGHLRVAMVNDHGFKYGAGIAHLRIATGFKLAGHEVRNFDLQAYNRPTVEQAEVRLSEDVEGYLPDLVVFGNIHSATRNSVFLISRLEKKYPTFWLTHDFWLFTGRCAYVGNCDKYKTGCDVECPTYKEYPDLLPAQINSAWQNKRKVLSTAKNLTVLANSNWAGTFAKNALGGFNNQVHVEQIKLGVPAEIFKPGNKQQARENLGVSQENFTLVFSVSALSDKRKGGYFLIEALQTLKLPNISVILIGHLNEPFLVEGIEFISLGYVENIELLVQALSAADIFVAPSKEETLGQVFLEAAMCGTPSVGFDLTGVKDAIIEGVTGIRVKQMSAVALAEVLARLYHDRKYTEELGKLAHLYAVNEFSIEASYRSFFNVFDRLGLVDIWKLSHKISFK